MSAESQCRTSEGTAERLTACCCWLTVCGFLAVLVYMVVDTRCVQRMERATCETGRRLMTAQMDQLRRGEIHCLCQPDPALMEELVADAACAENVHEVYVGGDVSDERLGRLRDLPHLSCIVFIMAVNPDALLERLQGMTTIEQVTLAQSTIARRGVEAIRSFPQLKSLCLAMQPAAEGDLQPMANHPSIETLVLSRVEVDAHLKTILESLPRLRSVVIEDPASGDAALEESLRQVLPDCQCKVTWTR
jgi:hypothetical protein